MNSNIINVFNIPTISSNRHYWIIRTNSGEYYQDFVLHEYISISWDYISLNMLNNQTDEEIKRVIEVYEQTSSSLSDDDEENDGTSKGKITAILNKIHRFVFEISRGDIILIPSRNSDFITIAEVIGDVYESENYVETYLKENPDTEIKPCPYKKRRRIKTLKTIPKAKMDIYLAKGFNSQHALSNMDEYAPFINRTIYGIYSVGDELHTILHAGHPNGLSLKELVELSTYIETASNSLAEQCGIPFDSSQVEVKLNIHSPGLIELIGTLSGCGIILSILIFSINNFVNGGKLNITLNRDGAAKKLNFSITSDAPGIQGNAQENKRIELKEKTELLELVDRLDIKTPEIVSAILNEDKITPEMISVANSVKESSLEPENSMQKTVESPDNPPVA